jgi:chemotaxis protein MotB
LLAALALALTTGGCAGSRLQQERDRLWSQNQELQDNLNRTRSALDAAEADRDRLQREAANLRLQADQLQNRAPVDTSAAGTGFSGIEGVETFADRGRITVRVPGDVLFDSGKVTLKSSALKTLDQIASVIQSQYPTQTIRVEGYTDTDPIRKSNWQDNLDLSLERAAAVHRHLQKKGVDPHRMEAVGLGEWQPRPTKAQSRRVEIVVVTY